MSEREERRALFEKQHNSSPLAVARPLTCFGTGVREGWACGERLSAGCYDDSETQVFVWFGLCCVKRESGAEEEDKEEEGASSPGCAGETLSLALGARTRATEHPTLQPLATRGRAPTSRGAVAILRGEARHRDTERGAFYTGSTVVAAVAAVAVGARSGSLPQKTQPLSQNTSNPPTNRSPTICRQRRPQRRQTLGSTPQLLRKREPNLQGALARRRLRRRQRL